MIPLAQADHITVAHGSLTVDVPRSIFRGPECEIDPERAAPFKRMIQDRYPWINDNSMEVLLTKARKEMIRVRDEETNGRSHSANLASKGKLDEAIAHLKLHLESKASSGVQPQGRGLLVQDGGAPLQGRPRRRGLQGHQHRPQAR